MRKIFCPVDFSEVSTTAVKWSLNMATQLDAALILFHSVHLEPSNPLDNFNYSDDLSDEVEKAKDQLSNLCELHLKRQEFNTLDIGFKVTIGFAVDEIKKIVKDENVDLIVMGTKGEVGLDTKLFGTTTNKITSQVNCPVLVIPDGREYKPFSNIIFATELETEEAEVIDYVVPLARKFKSHLHFLNIQKKELKEAENEIITARTHFLNKYDYKNITFHVSKNAHVIDGVNEYAQKANGDLIVMATHKRSFIERLSNVSITKEMVAHPLLPVLVLHIK